MKRLLQNKYVSQFASLMVLIILCVYYSVVTLDEHYPITSRAARKLAAQIVADHQGSRVNVLIIVRDVDSDRPFANELADALKSRGATVVDTVFVQDPFPASARIAVEGGAQTNERIDAIATHYVGANWGPLKPDRLAAKVEEFPALRDVRVYQPASYVWPNFLTRANIVNVINQNADIAIIAIGMTMVIITAGIDLSVGSLVALSGVVTAVCIQGLAGGENASTIALIGCAMAGMLTCTLCGAFNGVMVTVFRIPAFIVTLALMEIARGLALKTAVAYKSATSSGPTAATPEAITIQADAFGSLSNGEIFGVPNPIWLMLLLYVIAHFVMTRTSLGRYIYAVGGNREAARLSGVPVFGVLILVYAIAGLTAGLAGVVDASRFEGGRPNAGELYELRVIAAVVVGGTSLAGGEGRIFGTLIGALIIAVIQNGLNMEGVQAFDQRIVFGLLILAAALIDAFRKFGLPFTR